MSDDATFEPIQQDSEQRMFGPRAVLLCGFDAQEQERLAEIVSRFPSLPLSVVRAEDEQKNVGALLERPDRTGFGEKTTLPRLVLMSGLTQQELHRFMGAYRETGLTRPMWAALTPTSATWTLAALLEELDAERKAMEQAQAARAQGNESGEGRPN